MEVEVDFDDLLGAGQSMPSYLQCPVCLDSLNDPRMLSCSHTVCCACLDNLIRFSTERPTNGNGSGRIISCPVCRRKFTMVSADKLLQNRGLAEAVSDWKRREKEGQFTRFQNFIKFCSVHKSSSADLWCATCRSNICTSCLSSENDHSDHEVENIEDIESFSCARANLLSSLLSVQEKIPDLVSRLHKVLTYEFDVRDAYLRWSNDVADQEIRAHNIIADKFKMLRTSGQATTNQTINSLRNERSSGFETLTAVEDFFSSAPSIMQSKSLQEENVNSPRENALSKAANFLEVTEGTFKANIRDFREILESPLTKIRDTVDRLQTGNLQDPRRRGSSRQHVIHGRVTSRHTSGRRSSLNPRLQPQQIRIINPGTRLHIIGQGIQSPQQQQQPNPLLQPNIFLPQQHQMVSPQIPFGVPLSPRFSTSNRPLFFSFSNAVGNPATLASAPPAAAAAAAAAAAPGAAILPGSSPVFLTPLRPASSTLTSSPMTGGRGQNDMGNFFMGNPVHPIETVVRTEPSNRPSTAPNMGSASHSTTQPNVENPSAISSQRPSSSTALDTGHESGELWTDSGMDISESLPSNNSAQSNIWPPETGQQGGGRNGGHNPEGVAAAEGVRDIAASGAAEANAGAQSGSEMSSVGSASGTGAGVDVRGAGVEAGGMDYSPYGPGAGRPADPIASPDNIQHTPSQPPPLDYPPGRLDRESVRDIPLPPGSPPNPYRSNQDRPQSPSWTRYQNQNGNNSNYDSRDPEDLDHALSSPDRRRENLNINNSNLYSRDGLSSRPWGPLHQVDYVNDHTYYGPQHYSPGYYVQDMNEYNYDGLDHLQDASYENIDARDYSESYGTEQPLYHRPIETIRMRGQPSLQGRRVYSPRNLIRLPLARENLTSNIDLYNDQERHSIEDSSHETSFMETHL